MTDLGGVFYLDNPAGVSANMLSPKEMHASLLLMF